MSPTEAWEGAALTPPSARLILHPIVASEGQQLPHTPSPLLPGFQKHFPRSPCWDRLESIWAAFSNMKHSKMCGSVSHMHGEVWKTRAGGQSQPQPCPAVAPTRPTHPSCCGME